MAENKKSFVLYADLLHTVQQLPDDKAGLLFKHILKYVNDLNPETKDLIVKVAFEPIKQQLKRDLLKWDDIRVKRSESGKLGGRPKKQIKAKKANGLFDKQIKAKKAVNVNVNVNDIFNKIKDRNLEELFMKLSIEPILIDKYLNEFESKLLLDTENKTEQEIFNWFYNWLKLQPKRNLKYFSKDEILNKGLNRNREYIKADNTQGYHALMTNEEKQKSGFNESDLVTIHKELL